MTNKSLIAAFACASALAAPPLFGASDFDALFTGSTLRVDYYHEGDASAETFALDRMVEQGPWAGPRANRVDPCAVGRYRVRMVDAASGETLYTKGFDSYFGEYRTTSTAAKGAHRSYHESALVPLPKKSAAVFIETKDAARAYQPSLRVDVDPSSNLIYRLKPPDDVKLFPVLHGGPPAERVDVVVLGEGYVAGDEAKFEKDVGGAVQALFGVEPFKGLKSSFNVTGALRLSQERGCTEPGHCAYRRTSLNCSFDSLGSERYVLTEDNRSMRDIASCVPYDAVMVVVNSPRYGGGGIYNSFLTFTSDNQWRDYLVVHEFGHSFAGLADEYYTSSTAYNDFYPKGKEPEEPNITALAAPSGLKWKHLVKPGTEIPTRWEKAEFDKMDYAYQRVRAGANERVAVLKRSGAGKAEVDRATAEAEAQSREHARKVDDFLAKSERAGLVGAFEGAGYAAEGLYRPMLDCLMFTKGTKPFCAVCADAIAQKVKFYCDGK